MKFYEALPYLYFSGVISRVDFHDYCHVKMVNNQFYDENGEIYYFTNEDFQADWFIRSAGYAPDDLVNHSHKRH